MKFVCVKEAPKDLRKGEYIIAMPNFIEEVQSNAQRKGSTSVTRNKHLRHLIGTVGMNYGPEEFSPYTDVRTQPYEGLPFKTDEDLSKILVRIFEAEYPAMFDHYIAKKIKGRPMATKVIYFVGDFLDSKAFTEAGFECIKSKEIDVALGLKKGKIVGKPAVSDILIKPTV